MPSRSVSEFFKSMFRRAPDAPENENTCHQCNQPLAPESMGPRSLERCPDCRGIWLSQAQLREILDQVGQKVEAELEAVESDGHADIAHTFAPSRLTRKCPSCAQDMENLKFEGTGVWIDACLANHGIWLDQGELRLLARKNHTDGTEYDTGEVMDAVSDLILGSL